MNDCGENEGESFPGACRCDANHVSPAHYHGQCPLLDRRRLSDPIGLKLLKKVPRQAGIRELLGGLGHLSRGLVLVSCSCSLQITVATFRISVLLLGLIGVICPVRVSLFEFLYVCVEISAERHEVVRCFLPPWRFLSRLEISKLDPVRLLTEGHSRSALIFLLLLAWFIHCLGFDSDIGLRISCCS